MHSKQKNRGGIFKFSKLQTCRVILFSARFNTTGNILYSNKPPASPQLPASAPRDESFRERQMHRELFFCPQCVFLQNSCGRDAGYTAEDF